MKSNLVCVLVLALAVYCAPAFAQHGHAPGGPAGMGSANGMGLSSHASNGVNNASPHAGSAAASKGRTMDQLLTQNTKLSDKISSLTGESAQQSCTGFKNLGQCVAAAHVSKNLGIRFDCLKSDMTGTKSMSLGKSIQTLSPTTNSNTEAKKGQQQANQDLKDTTSKS